MVGTMVARLVVQMAVYLECNWVDWMVHCLVVSWADHSVVLMVVYWAARTVA